MTAKVAEALDTVKLYVRDHYYFPHTDRAFVHTHDEKEWLLEYTSNYDGFTIPHYGLSCSTKAITFGSLDELRGWLRCYRSFTLNG